jgi:hypothetical protein
MKRMTILAWASVNMGSHQGKDRRAAMFPDLVGGWRDASC